MSSRPQSSIKVEPIGLCIYCGKDEGSHKLTDEHAVPYALSGELILPKASCRECAKITGSVEQKILRGMLWEARTHLNVKTRNKKERPQSFPLTEIDGDKRFTSEVSLDSNPLVLRLPNLLAPPILTGERTPGWVGHASPPFWQFLGANTAEQDRIAKAWGTKYERQFKYSPTTFALFLAKIAYSSAVYFYGYQSFHSDLPRLICTESADVSEYVGGCSKPALEDRNTILHLFFIETKRHLVAEISLFPNLGAPYYQVVVGLPSAT